MPKKYRPFEVMKETSSRERLRQPARILYGPIGPPPDHFDFDEQVAWLDLVSAAPLGTLEKHHRFFLETAANLLSRVRRGEADRTSVKVLGKYLRDMGLRPGTEPTPTEMLEAFRGCGPVN